MSSSAHHPPKQLSRHTLLRTGLAATAGLLATQVAGPTAATADQTPTTRPPLVDPHSGLDGIKQLLAGVQPLTWVFTGDSITHGALHTLGWRSYPEHFAERVRWEMRRVRDIVINTGISGNRTVDVLNDFEWRAARFQPNVVSVMLGMNDCSAGESGREMFGANLKEIGRRVIAAGAVPLLNTPNPTYLKNAGGRSDLPAYVAIVRDVAASEKIALVDHWQHWQQTKPDQESLLPWLEDKSIHPGVYGHREFAKLIFRELGIFAENSPTCRLEVP